MSLRNLKLLHSIIGDAIDELQSTFQAQGLDYPSLEKSYELDASEKLAAEPSLQAASNSIIAAADQLIATVRRPFTSVCAAGMSFLVSACFRAVEHAHVVEILREAGEPGLHVDDIASRTNIDSSKLAHAMRLLATHHVFREVTPGVFKNNRISSYIDTHKTAEDILKNPEQKYEDTTGMAAFIACAGDEFFKSSAYLTEALSHPTMGRSRQPNQTAFNIAWSTNKPFFEFLEQPENKYRAERLGMAIKSSEGFSVPTAIIRGFPWGDLPRDSVVVDVGGGVGSSMLTLHAQFPHVKCIIQDQRSMCAFGENLWRMQAPEALLSGRVQFQAHDFFEPQPVANSAVFYLRAILHDWSDTFAVNILLRIRHAATSSTKLVIADHLLAYACPDDSGAGAVAGSITSLASGPLLANMGKANSTIYDVDMNMLVMFNGQERTIFQLMEITGRSGWKIVEVRGCGEGLFGHVIAIPIEIPPA